MNACRMHYLKYQSGVATLPISLILLVLFTLITVYAARVGVLETRTSSNTVRTGEARTSAEAGLDLGKAYLNSNRDGVVKGAWTACANANFPCGDGSTQAFDATWLYQALDPNDLPKKTDGSKYADVYFLTPCQNDDGDDTCTSATPYSTPPITVIARGKSVDDTGEAIFQHTVYFFSIGGGGAGIPVPLMAAGEIGSGGTFDVVANPNGGGRGVAISAWSDKDVTLEGTAATCQLDEYLQSGTMKTPRTYKAIEDGNLVNRTLTVCADCFCPKSGPGSLSHNDAGTYTERYDILDKDGNAGENLDDQSFPTGKVFEYIFGVAEADWQTVKNQYVDPTHRLKDCSGITAASGPKMNGLYWVEGSCAISSTLEIGGDVSGTCKVKDTNEATMCTVLIVVEGDIKINAAAQVFGVFFAFDPAGLAATKKVTLNGGPTLYGAVISNANVDLSNGNYQLRFDSDLMANLGEGPSGSGYGTVPGTWSDYLPN